MMTFRPGQRLVIPSPGVQVFQPRVTSAASGGWWDNSGAISGCVAAYAAKGAASLAASYTNLANPGTYTAAPGVAPTFNTADGWTFNGSSQYLTTGVVPSMSKTWSFVARFSDVPGINTGHCVIGSSYTPNTTPYFGLIPRWTDGNAYYLNTGYLSATSKAGGVMAVAGGAAYYNGSAESGTISTLTAATAVALTIGAYNTSTSPTGFLSGKIQALAIYNVTLTAGEVATITTAMQAL